MNAYEQTVYIGAGEVDRLQGICAREGVRSIFLVTGKDSFTSSGAETKLQPLLSLYGITRFSDFRANPVIEDVERGMELFREKKHDIVLAVGGGSVLDLAKSVNALVHQKGVPREYIEGKQSMQENGMPLVAIPTTAGTGSEATHFAVCYIGAIKHSLAHPSLLPRYAIVDPQFTYSLSPYATACTGMDALAQAIESYWNVHATDESRGYAREAIMHAWGALPLAVHAPTKEVRKEMSTAAYLAGKAINITKTTAPHALSYPLTAHFGIPHGHAVALTLPAFFLYNSEEVDASGERAIRDLAGLLGSPTVYATRGVLEKYIDTLGLARKLSLLGVPEEGLRLIVRDGFTPERINNNPRRVTEEFVRNLYKEIY